MFRSTLPAAVLLLAGFSSMADAGALAEFSTNDRTCHAVERAITDIGMMTPAAGETVAVEGDDARALADRVTELLGYPTILADYAVADRVDDHIDVRLVSRDLCLVAHMTFDADEWISLFPEGAVLPAVRV